MTTKFFLNDKPISKKELQNLVGISRFNQIMEDAEETFMEDPDVENDFMVPGGTLTVVF